MTPLLGYLGALAIGAGLCLAIAGRGRRSPGAATLNALIDQPTDLHQSRLDATILARLGAPLVDRLVALGRRITPGTRSDALRRRLENAGLAVPVETFLAAKVVSVGAGMLLGIAVVVLTDLGALRATLAVLVSAGIGYALPEVLVLQYGQKRQEHLSRELPGALDLLALTVQAGLGLEQGLAEVTGEVTGPLGDELDRVLKEQQLGRSRREALEALHDRNRCEDLRALVSALLHADRLGTPIADTLRVQARELRRRRRGRARERAGKAPVKLLFPLIFGIFPAMFVVIIGPAAIQIAEKLL